MNVAAHQKKNENRARDKQKKEDRRPILKKLCAALLRSFGGSTAKNGLCGGSAWGNWDLQKGQQSFRPNSNGVGKSTTTLRRLLIGAAQFCSLYILYIRQKFRTLLFKKIGVNTCFGDGQNSVVDKQLICALCDKSIKICMYIPLRPKFSFRRGGIEFSDLGGPAALFMVPPKIGHNRQTLKL